jgi:hypothetical protein
MNAYSHLCIHTFMTEPDPIKLPIDGTLDLHTFQAREVKDLVPEYLAACREQGILRVRIIHGKGTGALKRTVQSILEKLPSVESFRTAEEMAGGWGAMVVQLQNITEVCDCLCHRSPHIVHVTPCCSNCPHCKRNISNYYYKEHIKVCAEKKKAG